MVITNGMSNTAHDPPCTEFKRQLSRRQRNCVHRISCHSNAELLLHNLKAVINTETRTACRTTTQTCQQFQFAWNIIFVMDKIRSIETFYGKSFSLLEQLQMRFLVPLEIEMQIMLRWKLGGREKGKNQARRRHLIWKHNNSCYTLTTQ
jgi:hypothetical protein